MAFFRSERMSLCEMLLHEESAFDCLIELGYMGVVQFNADVNTNQMTNRKFVSEIHRLSDLQRSIKRLEDEMEELDLPMVFYPDVDADEIPSPSDTKDIEQAMEKIESELTEVTRSYDELKSDKIHFCEHYYVLKKANEFVTGSRNTETIMAWSDSIIMSLIRDEVAPANTRTRESKLRFFAGTILAERIYHFELMLFRTSRGNFYLRYAEIPELIEETSRSQRKVRKYVFMLFFIGDMVRERIVKICQGFHVNLYECPESIEERYAECKRVEQNMIDLNIILEHTDEQRRRILLLAGADLYIWKIKVKKMLMVYHSLNMMSSVEQLHNQKYMHVECWIPQSKLASVQTALIRGARRASLGGGMMFPPSITVKPRAANRLPPTYFELNKFTRGFQNLIDSYGIATYHELNPAPYTIVTFPFLFAVMFGDMGHGLIMSIFGLWMIRNESDFERKQQITTKQNEIWTLLFGGRYIILLMGLFSIYTGFIYNDFFSKSLNVFGSYWRVNYTRSDIMDCKELQLDPARPDHYLGVPYIFGMDPVWGASGENAIITMNSYKMKMAIILGVIQMVFGLCLAAWDFAYQDNYVDLVLVTMPQLGFLLSLFFYLAVLIFYKWSNFGGDYEMPHNAGCAPSILITFINMILLKSSDKTPEGCDETMYEGQPIMQTILLVVAFLCVPILLAGKPLYIMRQQRALQKTLDATKKQSIARSTLDNVRKSLIYAVEYVDESQVPGTKEQPTGNVKDIEITEVWIHQGIHCIESVLGAVSHTASYLRLWALSLAHDQLSTVLWNMVLATGLKMDHGYATSIVLYLVFWVWAILTISILVVMEGLSAFLHTLRLHWVEFQSKFYEGAGELFVPFRFPQSRRSD